MKRYLVLSILLVMFCAGCSGSVTGPKEPAGASIELTEKEKELASFVYESKREWYMWHAKGIRLSLDGRYQESIYCFHKAMAAWPKTIPAEEEKKSIGGHRSESTDTILQKAAVYMKMKEPALALYYLEKFQKYFPYDQSCSKMIEEAKKMMGK